MPKTMMLLQQYQLIKGARIALFNYLDGIPFEQLRRQIPAYNNASVCYLLKHVADVYLYWIKNVAMRKESNFKDVEALESMSDVKEYYITVDDIVTNFINDHPDINTVIACEIKKQQRVVDMNVLTLFTHVTTHEFHHKGQILNMTRHLGYTPVDTDIIRT